MRYQQHCNILGFRQAGNQLRNRLLIADIQIGQRLIQKKKARLAEQGLGKQETLPAFDVGALFQMFAVLK